MEPFAAYVVSVIVSFGTLNDFNTLPFDQKEQATNAIRSEVRDFILTQIINKERNYLAIDFTRQVHPYLLKLLALGYHQSASLGYLR